jgi:hypothetical protein
LAFVRKPLPNLDRKDLRRIRSLNREVKSHQTHPPLRWHYALCPGLRGFTWPSVSSTALHVVEFAFYNGFESLPLRLLMKQQELAFEQVSADGITAVARGRRRLRLGSDHVRRSPVVDAAPDMSTGAQRCPSLQDFIPRALSDGGGQSVPAFLWAIEVANGHACNDLLCLNKFGDNCMVDHGRSLNRIAKTCTYS